MTGIECANNWKQKCVEYTRDNPLFRTGLCDHIHTAHINQLIGELIRR